MQALNQQLNQLAKDNLRYVAAAKEAQQQVGAACGGGRTDFLLEVVAICLPEVGLRGDLSAWWGKRLSVGMVGQGRCVASATDAVICHTVWQVTSACSHVSPVHLQQS